MDLHISWSFFIPLLIMLTEAKKDKELYCAVCRALVDEVNFSIGEVDPKKVVQVGSFRIDGNGDQLTRKIPLARSELYLTELLEGMCEKFKDYAESTSTSDGKKSIVRTSSRNGKALSLSNISISSEKQKLIHFACDTIIEDHEEDIITVFKKYTDVPEIEDKFCREIAALCSEEDLQISMPSSEMTPEQQVEYEKGGASDSDDTDVDDGDNVNSDSETNIAEDTDMSADSQSDISADSGSDTSMGSEAVDTAAKMEEIPMQETILADFPEEEYVTMTNQQADTQKKEEL